MNKSETIEWLAEEVGRATRSAGFCASGRLEVVDPGLEVEGLGAVKLPLKPAAAKKLLAACKPAPYGKGTRTLVDKRVRNTFELDPKRFRLGDAWNAAVDEILPSVAERLGLPADRLEARLYKLLAYEKGGFFVPHRDSEKHDRMVASLIVALPNPFQGGKLVVRHGAVEQELRFEEAADGKAPCYAAFFADCEHEVTRVYHGVRLCLAYNLVLKPSPRKKSPTADAAPGGSGALASSIATWVARQPADPLVFALDHHYTERGLSLDLLKGDDRRLADLVAAAAEKAGCLVHLAQVERHLTQEAYGEDRGYDRGWDDDDEDDDLAAEPGDDLEIGETFEDELTASHWADVEGREQPWGAVALDLAAVVCATPINEWRPTAEEYEGYTGNAGNTLDRWYHRSAIVLWHRDHHFDVVASSGAAESMPLFLSMTAKLKKAPKKRIEEHRADCIRFARAIINEWPRDAGGYWYEVPKASPLDVFPDQLLALGDQETVARFLSKMAELDETTPLDSFIPAACRAFGWGAFAPELKELLAPRADARDEPVEVPSRDVAWLAAFCLDKSKDPDKAALADALCATAAARFRETRPRRDWRRRPEEPTDSEASLPDLLKALMASGRDEDLARVIRFVEESPDAFRMDECLVPGLKALVPWARKRFKSTPPALAEWLASVRRRLESATAARPKPPADWARAADLDCNCDLCAQLKTFLADPSKEVLRIPAREDRRIHMVDMLKRRQCDVKDREDRTGRPYSLVLTKTTGSFDRAVKRYEADRSLLATLPAAE